MPLSLVADIGGTNARFALIDRATFAVGSRLTVHTAEEPSLEAALGRWLKTLDESPREAALAVAGPVTQDLFSFTNSPWSFSRSDLQVRLGLDRLLVLNDFEALALSLPHLPPAGIATVGSGMADPGRAIAVLGPGTGLGVGGLLPAGPGRWIALPSEGGHVSFAAETEAEFSLLMAMGLGSGRLSAERLLSGPGLAAVYEALAGLVDEEPDPLGAPLGLGGEPAEPKRREPLTGETVTQLALERMDPIAVKALDLFVLWLGRFAGDVALTLGARGGVYIAGGIAPRILPLLADGRFRAAFEAKGRLSPFVEAIPLHVITTPDAALIGAASAL